MDTLADATINSLRSSSHDLFCNLAECFDNSPPPILLHLLAMEIFSNFLRALVLGNGPGREHCYENFLHNAHRIEEFSVHLTVCPDGFAPKLATLPALLARDAQQADKPKSSQEDEIEG